MAINLFGLVIGRQPGKDPSDGDNERKIVSFVPPEHEDGAVPIEAGGYYGASVDFDGAIKSDIELIQKYREMSLQPEAESAIADICNEAIVYDESHDIVKIDVAKVKLSKPIKDKIEEEFAEVLRLLHTSRRGFETFRKWYIDSRLYYHIIVDEKNKKKGIIELRPVDPTKIRKIRKINKKPIADKNISNVRMVTSVEEFYIYNEQDPSPIAASMEGLKISPDAICFVHSGLYDSQRKKIVGYLHKAIKSLNQLRMIEDAVVIYRITRAPERRIFYVDVGNLPKQKAEEYVAGLMRRFRTKLTYDPVTGEIADQRKHMSMLEDYWMPRREGGKGTEITTIPGGQNLGEMEDVKYFQKKLYQSLNVPVSRLEESSGFNLGRSSEISRDEVKFFKFIERLRMKFSEVFWELLRVQLVLKGIIREDEWSQIEGDLIFQFKKDSHFIELKENEVLNTRLLSATQSEDFIGKYYSRRWVRKNILRQTDEDIDEIDAQIEKEMKSGVIVDPAAVQDPNASPTAAPTETGGETGETGETGEPSEADIEAALSVGEITTPPSKKK